VGSHERSANIERQLERLEELVQGRYVEAKCDRVSVKCAIFFCPSRRDLAKGRLQLGDGETYAPLVVLAQVLKEQPTSGAQSQLLDSEAKTLVVAKEETSVQVAYPLEEVRVPLHIQRTRAPNRIASVGDAEARWREIQYRRVAPKQLPEVQFEGELTQPPPLRPLQSLWRNNLPVGSMLVHEDRNSGRPEVCLRFKQHRHEATVVGPVRDQVEALASDILRGECGERGRSETED
jgi:hypothetical protein